MRTLTLKEVQKNKNALKKVAEKAALAQKLDYGKDNKNSAVFKAYSTSSVMGQAVYLSFSDEELLELLRQEAKRLGHSPAQKEVFWVYRFYVRHRFHKWPYALEKAGLSRSAGKSGKSVDIMLKERRTYQYWLEKVKERALELERPPHAVEMPEACENLKRYFKTWAEVLYAAGVNRNWMRQKVVSRIPDIEEEYKILLNGILKKAIELGRPPLKVEIDQVVRKKLKERCGSWRNVLFQIGLEPVTKISPFSSSYLDEKDQIHNRPHKEILQDSLYRVLNLDQKARKYLIYLRKKAEDLGRAPIKEELSADMVQYLICCCGTWSNTLYQIGYKPLRGDKLKAVKREKRKHAAKK